MTGTIALAALAMQREIAQLRQDNLALTIQLADIKCTLAPRHSWTECPGRTDRVEVGQD